MSVSGRWNPQVGSICSFIHFQRFPFVWVCPRDLWPTPQVFVWWREVGPVEGHPSPSTHISPCDVLSKRKQYPTSYSHMLITLQILGIIAAILPWRIRIDNTRAYYSVCFDIFCQKKPTKHVNVWQAIHFPLFLMRFILVPVSRLAGGKKQAFSEERT